MTAAATGHIRCENGQILEVDLPLSDAFAGRLKRGEIVRVNADGTSYEDAVAVQAAAAKQALADGLAQAKADCVRLIAELVEVKAERDQLREALAAATAPPAPPPVKPGK